MAAIAIVVLLLLGGLEVRFCTNAHQFLNICEKGKRENV